MTASNLTRRGAVVGALLFSLLGPAPRGGSSARADCPASANLTGIAPVSGSVGGASCAAFVAVSPTDGLYSASGARLWLAPALGSPYWTSRTATQLGLAGTNLRAAACGGGRLYVATEKGLEWVTVPDFSSAGSFSSASGFGSGVSALVVVDAGHVLAGLGPGGPGGILRCDVATGACAGTSGFGGGVVAGFHAVGGVVFALSGSTLYRSSDGGATWAPQSGVQAYPYRGITGHGTRIFLWGSGITLSNDSGTTWAAISPPGTYEVLTLRPDAGSVGWFLHTPALGGVEVWRYTGSFRQHTTTGLTGTALSLVVTAAPTATFGGSAIWVGTTNGLFRANYSTDTTVPLAFTRYDDGLCGAPATVLRVVPVVLDVIGRAHYATELTLTNRGAGDAQVALQYQASRGEGSGTVAEVLHGPSNFVIPDVMAYLRSKGLSIPGADKGAQVGTLLATFSGLSESGAGSVVARTTAATVAPQPVGSAGLAYSSADPATFVSDTLTIYGLRATDSDRANLAVYNPSSEPVTFSVTAFRGDGSGASKVVASADSLPPWGWNQYDNVLALPSTQPAYDNGWVTVRRTSASGRIGSYGVINDNSTNDGSFIVPAPTDPRPLALHVPVLVETSSFVSEVVLTNSSSLPGDFLVSYRESLGTPGAGDASAHMTVPARTQRIIPNALAYLRGLGIAVGTLGGTNAGTLAVSVVSGAGAGQIYAGARTASVSPAGGQFGLFTPGVFSGDEGASTAWIYGLHADANNRSNVGAANVAVDSSAGAITLTLDVFDGDAGGAPHGPFLLTLAPGQWGQISGILGSAGVANGWVRITRTSGTAPWIAYGVVNDGGAPGQRTGDGAYVPMERP